MATQETTSMVSETAICNIALSLLAQSPISSLEDPSRSGEWMKNNYAFLRDAVLESRLWTFATARVESESAEASVWGGQFVHAVPIGWLSVKQVYTDVSASDESHWQMSKGWTREGYNVYSKDAIVYMRGIDRIVDTGKFSPMFVQTLAARIAAEAAIPFTENRALYSDKWNIYELLLRQAAESDGQQSGNRTVRSDRLIDIRR